MAQEQWTADDIRRILTDPGYCLSVPPVIPEDQWIKAGARLIEIRAEECLRLLLDHFRLSEWNRRNRSTSLLY
jgi:hypothetical protein